MTFAIWHRGFQSRAAMLQTLASLLRSVDSTLVARATGLGGREGETETLDEKRGGQGGGVAASTKEANAIYIPPYIRIYGNLL